MYIHSFDVVTSCSWVLSFGLLEFCLEPILTSGLPNVRASAAQLPISKKKHVYCSCLGQDHVCHWLYLHHRVLEPYAAKQ